MKKLFNLEKELFLSCLYRKIILISLIVILQGCQGMKTDPGQSMGSIFGEAAEKLMGPRFRTSARKTAAVIVDSAQSLGVWAGSEIGKYFDKKDQSEVENKSAQALESAEDGKTVTWKNQESGNSATITPSNTRKEQKSVKYYRSKRIEPISNIDLIGEQYVAPKNVNLRSSPNTHSAIVGWLRSGQEFNAMGKVKNKNWIVVAKGDRTVGYVYAPMVQPVTHQPVPVLRRSVNLDDVESTDLDNTAKLNQPRKGTQQYTKSADLDEMPINSLNLDELSDDDFVAETTVATTQCRKLDYTLATKNGQNESNSFEACKDATGSWEIN